MAALTFSIIDVAVRAWYRGVYKDLRSATKDALSALASLIGSEAFAAPTNSKSCTIKPATLASAKRKKRAAKPRN